MRWRGHHGERVWKGQIVWGSTLAEVLAELRIPPDLACHETVVGDEIRYIHRSVEGDEIYFVASGVPEARRFLCTFRAKGKMPEFWWPDTGRTEPVAVYEERGESTAIPLAVWTPTDRCSWFSLRRFPARRTAWFQSGGTAMEISGLAAKPAPETQLLHEFARRFIPAGSQGRI